MLGKILVKFDISLILVAIIGLGLSLTAFYYVKQWELKQIVEYKRRQADEHVRVLRQTFITFDNILNSIKGLHHVHDDLARQHFSQFVKHDLLTQPGIQALLWIPAVPNTSRAELEKQIRNNINLFVLWEYAPNGQKQIATQREAYYPILFAEPYSEHIELLGYDINTEPVLKTALEKAKETGLLTTSGAIDVTTATGKKLGFWLLLPIYTEEDMTTAVRQLVGFAAGIFLFDDLVQTVLRLPKQRTDVFLRIFDDTPLSQIQELYSPPWYQAYPEKDATELWSTTLEFGGRLWRIVFYKTTEDNWLYQTWYAWIVLGMGLLFTIGLLRYIYIILIHARWAETMIVKRTQSLSEANEALSKEIQTREQMTLALESSRQRFQAIFNEAAIGIAQLDLNDKILECNRALQTLLRYREDELRNKFLKKFTHPDDSDIDNVLLQKMLAGKYDSYQVSKRYICKNGAIIWTIQSCSIVRNTTNPFIISMIEDITERKIAEEALLEAEKKYRDIFENAIEGIFQCTPDGRYLSVNPAFVRIFGYESDQQVYSEITDIGKQLYVNPQRRLEFLKLLKVQSDIQDFEYQAYCRNGKIIWVNETVRVVRDRKNHILYYEGIVEDITERKQIEEKLRYDATHDQLTGLFNRAAFTYYLTQALERLKDQWLEEKLHDNQANPSNGSDTSPVTTEPKIPFAVLFIDLDRFKIVNDSMGHLVGDQLLTETARRLNRNIRHNEIVARFGGDEFALMLANLPNLTILEHRVENIQEYLCQPYTISEETFNTTASIGVALGDSKYNSADEILRDADTAMYEAKQQGRGKSLIFQPGMHTHLINQLKMESDLRKALERNEFTLYYQPIISLDTLLTVGLEALIRWKHPEQGFIRPDIFIPVAEETGLIREIGLWVFETACQQLHHWQTQFSHHIKLGMNINVSPIQLKQPKLVQRIQDIIEKADIGENTCRVEITEGAMMQDPESALRVLHELKNLKVLLYVDDFGTGYSSLNYLHKFPIDALKIDRSFIKDIDGSTKSAQIAQAIIALGKAFELKVVAEGVETDVQVSMLKAAHCHQVQGYFFSRPKDSKDIENFLRTTTPMLVSSTIH